MHKKSSLQLKKVLRANTLIARSQIKKQNIVRSLKPQSDPLPITFASTPATTSFTSKPMDQFACFGTV